MYYNPEGGQYYHADAYCSSVRDQYLPMTGFLYSELETPQYKELEPCLTCQPPRPKSELAKENLERGAITQEEYLAALTPIPYPDDSLEIYYNPDGGQYYHSTANCSSVKDRFLPLTGFTYGELDTGSFAELTPCPYCDPVQRKAEIDEENRAMGLTVTPQAATVTVSGEDEEAEAVPVMADTDDTEVHIQIVDGP